MQKLVKHCVTLVPQDANVHELELPRCGHPSTLRRQNGTLPQPHPRMEERSPLDHFRDLEVAAREPVLCFFCVTPLCRALSLGFSNMWAEAVLMKSRHFLP